MSEATKHTAGPWTIERVTSGGHFVYARIGPDGRGSIAYSGVYGPQKDNARLSVPEAEANARLIAATPDLLAALERVEARLTVVARAFYGAGKAKDLRAAFGGWRDDIDPARAALAKAGAS